MRFNLCFLSSTSLNLYIYIYIFMFNDHRYLREFVNNVTMQIQCYSTFIVLFAQNASFTKKSGHTTTSAQIPAIQAWLKTLLLIILQATGIILCYVDVMCRGNILIFNIQLYIALYIQPIGEGIQSSLSSSFFPFLSLFLSLF